MAQIYVLRLGHRATRDKRITTHVCLVARAFGATGCVIAGDYDQKVLNSVNSVTERWGGPFFCMYVDDWRGYIRDWRNQRSGIVVHLTMYGINIVDRIDELRRLYSTGYDFLVVVGAEKVPREMYDIADYNIAIGHQPHSEVAALAIFLDWLQEGRELVREFVNPKLKIIPMEKGKKVIWL